MPHSVNASATASSRQIDSGRIETVYLSGYTGALGFSAVTTATGQRDHRDFDAKAITRPDDALLAYYIIVSLAALIAFPIVFLPRFVRFKTMRYRFDDEGVSMRWGLLFRREVYLTYRRVQDIHVTRNIIERWMGLAKVPIQTASGTSGATMTIEGIRNPEPLRDYLYERMRGARGLDRETVCPEDEALALLRQIRDELRSRRS
jgi:membrane protein YdbS with pleckstrin-like domain